MLNRDFSKSNWEYVKRNKIPLIFVTIFLVAGLLMALIFGFNGNFEMKGYNEFGVTVGVMTKDDRNDAVDEIRKIVNAYDAEYETYSITGEGGTTEIIVRYKNDITSETQTKINQEIAEVLDIDGNFITTHNHVGGSVRAKDYIFTATGILIIMLIACIFSIFRYNMASAISLLGSSAIGTVGFMSFASILRLSIGLSFFAMIVILNILIVYFAVNIFETIRKESWLKNKDYTSAIESGLKHNRFKFNFFAIALMVVGLVFVIIGTPAIKYISINIMFMAVSVLAVALFVLPFFWNMLIALNNKHSKTILKSKKENE